jgi:hypothetical protein
MAEHESLIKKFSDIGFELAAPAIESPGPDKPTQLRLTGRVSKARIPTWLVAVETLCVEAMTAAWTVDISQHHFVLPPLAELVLSGTEPLNGSHIRFAWRVILQSSAGIVDHYPHILSVLERIQPVQAELMQIPLVAPPNRNAPVRGKGAQSMGSAVVGPAVFRRV